MTPFAFLAEETVGLTVQPYWVLVAIVQFGLLFFLLQKFLWGPIIRPIQPPADKLRETQTGRARWRERG